MRKRQVSSREGAAQVRVTKAVLASFHAMKERKGKRAVTASLVAIEAAFDHLADVIRKEVNRGTR